MFTKLRNYPRYYYGVNGRVIKVDPDGGTYTKSSIKVRIAYFVCMGLSYQVQAWAQRKAINNAYERGVADGKASVK